MFNQHNQLNKDVYNCICILIVYLCVCCKIILKSKSPLFQTTLPALCLPGVYKVFKAFADVTKEDVEAALLGTASVGHGNSVKK